MEVLLFSWFKIDVSNLIKIKVSLCKEYHIAPMEIDKMPFWEYEMFLNDLQDIVKEQNDEQQAEMDKYHVGDAMKMAKNPDKMMPKMPKIPSINMNMSSPKF